MNYLKKTIPFLIFILGSVCIAYTQKGVNSDSSQTSKSSAVLTTPDEFEDLDSVVLTGFGSTSKKNTINAVTNVGLARIADRNIKSAEEFLQGQVAGVMVMNNGGDPTQKPTINIRGFNSVNATTPLWIVDGVPYFGPPINPQDIKTMTVVKDAAAAIYGAQAAGGVILIETKGGIEGKTSINIQSAFGIKQLRNLPSVLTAKEFLDYNNLADNLDGTALNPLYDASKNPGIDETKTDWFKEISQLGVFQNYAISVNGGSEKLKTYSSLGYLKEKGTLLNTQFERFNFKINSAYTPLKKLKINFNLNANYSDGSGAGQSLYSGAIFLASAYPRALTPYDGNGNFRGIDLPGGTSAYGDLNNPVSVLLRQDIRQPKLNLFSVARLSYEFIEGLSYQLNASVNLDYENYKSFQPKVPEPGKPSTTNLLTESNSQTKRINIENLIKYKKHFDRHSVDAFVGYTYQRAKYTFGQIQGQDFTSEEPFFRYMANASVINKTESYGNAWEDVLISYIGKASYDYDKKYFVSAILRRDGSSRLNKENFWDLFPSFATGWNITELIKMQAISDIKLRASWGQTGNINALGYYGTVSAVSAGTTFFGENKSNVLSYYLNTIPNAGLRWEIVEQSDIGLEMSMINNKLNFTIDYYYKKTKDMLTKPDLLSTAGVSEAPFFNTGVLTNTGVEFSIKYTDYIGKKFKYTLSSNLAYNKNTINNLAGQEYIDDATTIRGLLKPIRNAIGQPIFSYYGYKTDGIFQTQQEIDNYVNSKNQKLQANARPGDFKFVNTNGDDVLDDKDRVFLGNPTPSFTYNFTANFTYAHFDLNIFLQGVQDVQLINAMKLTGYSFSIQQYNRLSQSKNSWTPDNTNTSIPRLSKKDANGNYGRFSDFYVEDGSYLRIKNISLGYTLPDMKKIFNQFRVFISVDNVFTFTKYSGIDPEIGANSLGIDQGLYPQSTTYSIGININF